MKRHAVELLPLCLAACLFVACQSESAPTSTPPPAPAARATTRWVPQHRDATTSQAVAVRHLDDRIAEVERLLRHRPGDVKLTARLVGELSIQASRLGQLVALDRMVALGEGAVTEHPDDPKAYALRARVRAAVHRFDEALADLDAAVERGLPASDTVGSRASILLGLGRYDEALRAAEEAETQRATSANVAVVAAILGHMERYADAEARFRQAEALYRGVNPFDLAWIYFTWGQMWEHAGKVEEAALRYRAALDPVRMGLAHIAFVEARLSDTREAALQAFNKAVRATPEIEECHMIAGGFDYLLKVRTGDIAQYRQVMAERISTLPHVAATSTYVAMETVKETGL